MSNADTEEAAIARKLTPAQRDVVVNMLRAGEEKGAAPHYPPIKKLLALELIVGRKGAFGTLFVRLTPLGLRVRALLEQEPQHEQR